MGALEAEFRPVPDGVAYGPLGTAHREGIAAAPMGSAVSLLCADMVLSRECFGAAEKQFAAGKRAIVAAATRTCGPNPPIGAASRDLLLWTMANRHPITRECFYGDGKSGYPWAVYFKKGNSIVLRAFHLHLFALIKRDNLKFSATSDLDLIENFPPAQTRVVTDADEMAMAEMSPRERTLPMRDSPMTPQSIAEWASTHALPVHYWLFNEHPITICGDGKCDERPICDEVIMKAIAIVNAA